MLKCIFCGNSDFVLNMPYHVDCFKKYQKEKEQEVQAKINTYEEVCKKLREERDEYFKSKTAYLSVIDDKNKEIQELKDKISILENEKVDKALIIESWSAKYEIPKLKIEKEKLQKENEELKELLQKCSFQKNEAIDNYLKVCNKNDKLNIQNKELKEYIKKLTQKRDNEEEWNEIIKAIDHSYGIFYKK